MCVSLFAGVSARLALVVTRSCLFVSFSYRVVFLLPFLGYTVARCCAICFVLCRFLVPSASSKLVVLFGQSTHKARPKLGLGGRLGGRPKLTYGVGPEGGPRGLD